MIGVSKPGQRRPRRDYSLVAQVAVWLFASTAVAQTAPSPVTGEQDARQAPDRFMISAFDVTGVTKLSAPEIERLIYPFVGPDRSTEDVIAAQKALQDAYVAKGFEAVLVDVPIQPEDSFAQGIVLLAVNETPVGQVEVVEARFHSAERVRDQLPSLVEGQPLNLQALQQELTEANRFPDRAVDPVFKPGVVAGTIDVDLRVQDDEPVHTSVDLNNDNSPNTEPYRVVGSGRYTDVWGLGHTVALTYSLSPRNREESEVFSASYTAPLIGTPWTLSAYGYRSNSNVAALGGTNVLGNGYQVGLRAIYRLPFETTFQQVSFGPDLKSFEESIFLGSDAIQPTQIRYLPLVSEYLVSGGSDRFTFNLTLGATAGFRVIRRDACFESPFQITPSGIVTCALGNGDTGVVADQFTGRAIDAEENFVHFNSDLNLTLLLNNDYQIATRFSAQLADSSLITNEQFSIGGMSSVRGYFVSEAVGDDGVISSIELRSADFGPALGSHVDELRLFAFNDFGAARIRAPSAGQADVFRLYSIGGGVRVRALDRLFLEAQVGVPLRNGPVSDRGEPRYRFSLKGEF